MPSVPGRRVCVRFWRVHDLGALRVRNRTNGVLVLLALPVLLTASTALVFTSLARWLGADLGYLLGFCFYWLWCVSVPLILFGKDGFL